MIVVTTENIPGYRVVEVKGTTFGLIVRARGIGGDIMAGLRSVVGGEIKEYTVLLEDARKQALDRMIKNATAMGANAVVMCRYDSGNMGNMGEVVAYGTAVVVEKA
ncbi:heavy metal-binding domain-containing protein [Brevibacillus sp. NPDC003359]|uniref:heavy metal-binding domain-containing protein n=1 Tax=unclassified Brevibacillus TaxID=2684853 RepID=UPI0036CBC72B